MKLTVLKVLALLTVLSMLVSACGGGAAPAPATQAPAPDDGHHGAGAH